MEKKGENSNQSIIKKLRKKAELCRFAHSELKAKYCICLNLKEFSIVLLSVSLAALIGFYYRKILEDELILTIVFLLPFAITIVQALDHTVFKWTNKLTGHKSAVAIWGDWIREADFLEKCIHQYPSDVANEKMRNIQEKYRACMSNTEQIPNNKFLKYKMKLRAHVLKSKKIDKMSLEDLEKKRIVPLDDKAQTDIPKEQD